MTDIHQTYASDNLRDTIEFQNGVAFDPVTIDGHIYGIPLTNDFSDEITLMYIRKDWMDNLGLSAPTTLTN
jgi:putative aldouronate transport system substrate-binding protein